MPAPIAPTAPLHPGTVYVPPTPKPNVLGTLASAAGSTSTPTLDTIARRFGSELRAACNWKAILFAHSAAEKERTIAERHAAPNVEAATRAAVQAYARDPSPQNFDALQPKGK